MYPGATAHPFRGGTTREARHSERTNRTEELVRFSVPSYQEDTIQITATNGTVNATSSLE